MLQPIISLALAGLIGLVAHPASARTLLNAIDDTPSITDFSAKNGDGRGGGGGKASRGGDGGGGKAMRGGGGGGGGPKFGRGGGDRPKFGRGGGDSPRFGRGGDRPKFDRGGGDRPKFGRGGGDRPKFGRGGGGGDRPKFGRGGADRPKLGRGGDDRPKFRSGDRGQRGERGRDRRQRIERAGGRDNIGREQSREQRRERVEQRNRNRDQLRELQSRQREQLRDKKLDRAGREKLRAQQRQERRELLTRQRDERRQQVQDRDRRRDQIRDQVNEERRAKRDEARRERAERREQRLRDRDNLRERRADDRRDRRRISDDDARRARFADRDRFERRRDRDFSRKAWRHGRRASFIAWSGPVFLPFIYTDLFDYTFFPYAYDPGYWGYVYDDFFDSMFWGYGSPYADPGFTAPLPRGGRPARITRQTRAAITQACTPDKGLTAWPFERIENAVKPDPDQQKLLDAVRAAASDAADAFKASCSTDFALTPPGRLSAMISRIEATLEALRIVRPPLEAFYNSLSDEQKERFNQIGPEIGRSDEKVARSRGTPEQDLQSCKEAAGLATAPIDRIEDVVQPTEAQRAAFQKLSDASHNAVETLQAACPNEVPLTPTGRLEAMQTRLEAMLDAAETVQPALEEFYAMLTNEQKARFNSLGRNARRVN